MTGLRARLRPRPVRHDPRGDPALQARPAVAGRDRRDHARCARDPRGDGVHEDRRHARDHGALHDPAAGGRVRGPGLLAPPRGRRRLGHGRDPLRRDRGPQRLGPPAQHARVARLREPGRAHHRGAPDPGADREARLPRRLHLPHRARRLPHRRRDPGGARSARRHARRRVAERLARPPERHGDQVLGHAEGDPGHLGRDARRLRCP